ncbi:MAG: hypothetical protein R3F40_17230 [Candidatus Competibacteraceae bacterium]
MAPIPGEKEKSGNVMSLPPTALIPAIRSTAGTGVDARRRVSCGRVETDRPSVWFGLGLFGIVGWTRALPAVLGALGLWLDRNWPSRIPGP